MRFSRLHIHHNDADGLYICWGIKNSLFEDCHIHHNGGRVYRSGISIGHKDTDNVLSGNYIHDNAKYGIAIRQKTEANGAHRNRFIGNRIENNGSHPQDIPQEVLAWLPEEEKIGVGVSICGITQDVVFENNSIRDTREGEARTQQIGMQIGQGVSGLKVENNEIDPPLPPAQSL